MQRLTSLLLHLKGQNPKKKGHDIYFSCSISFILFFSILSFSFSVLYFTHVLKSFFHLKHSCHVFQPIFWKLSHTMCLGHQWKISYAHHHWRPLKMYLGQKRKICSVFETVPSQCSKLRRSIKKSQTIVSTSDDCARKSCHIRSYKK